MISLSNQSLQCGVLMNIFILETFADEPGESEFRVGVFEFFGDIDYEERSKLTLAERQLKNARKFFKDSKIFLEFEEAIDYAEYLRAESSDRTGRTPFVTMITIRDYFNA
jgi:hypothetical protein